MSRKPFSRALPCAAAITSLAMLAVAQPIAPASGEGVARLKDVHGNVLVSKESGLASGDEALRLAKGTRVITTAKAEAIVAYDNGCEVRLKENQRFEVEVDKPCEALIAQAQSILAEPAGAVTAASAGGLAVYAALLPPLGGAGIGIAFFQSERETRKVSPS